MTKIKKSTGNSLIINFSSLFTQIIIYIRCVYTFNRLKLNKYTILGSNSLIWDVTNTYTKGSAI